MLTGLYEHSMKPGSDGLVHVCYLTELGKGRKGVTKGVSGPFCVFFSVFGDLAEAVIMDEAITP
jgi:hypothetical protein